MARGRFAAQACQGGGIIAQCGRIGHHRSQEFKAMPGESCLRSLSREKGQACIRSPALPFRHPGVKFP